MTEVESYGEFVKFPSLKEDSGSSREEVVKRAFKFANKCRDKEIDRFWTRGLYFWGRLC